MDGSEIKLAQIIAIRAESKGGIYCISPALDITLLTGTDRRRVTDVLQFYFSTFFYII